ncbi:MAG: phosphoribosyltransferase family protein [Usitatibacter sp.]
MQLLKFNAGWGGQDCALCNAASSAGLVCAECESRLPACDPEAAQGLTHRAAFDHAFAAFEYRFPMDRLVQRFKFSGDLAMGKWLALQLAQRAAPLPPPDWIVAPPLTAARLRARGFNQALEIAKVVGKVVGARVDVAAVVKLRETAPQPSLGGRARRRNLRGAFECRRVFAGEHVAIVDDVLTTGATCEAMARVLKDAGAGRVSAWAVALAGAGRR